MCPVYIKADQETRSRECPAAKIDSVDCDMGNARIISRSYQLILKDYVPPFPIELMADLEHLKLWKHSALISRLESFTVFAMA